MRSLQITDWCHAIFQTFVLRDGVYVDATMGKGRDTLFLCRLAGEKGQVWAFDIQEEALKLTGSLLETEGMSGRARLILCGHEHMDRYLEPERVDGICFNFGYLPGGDHRIATQAGDQRGGGGAGTEASEAGRDDESLHLQRRGYRIRGEGGAAWIFEEAAL